MIGEMYTSAIFLWRWQGGGCVSGLGMSADQAGYRLQSLRVLLSKIWLSVLRTAETFVLAPQQGTHLSQTTVWGLPCSFYLAFSVSYLLLAVLANVSGSLAVANC